jgi:hypothetical protein
MKRVLITLVSLMLSTSISAQSVTPVSDQKNASQVAIVTKSQGAMPLPFTKNMGQWPDSILFRASANGATMWFTKNGIWYQFFKRIERVDSVGRIPRAALSGLHPELVEGPSGGPDRSPDSIVTTMIKAEYVGASNLVQVVGAGELEYKCNYFIGNQPEKWRTDVPNYSAVTMRGIYSGVDISFSSEGGMLKESVHATQTEDLTQVRVAYLGAEAIQDESDNSTRVQTKLGEKRFEGALLVENAASRQERQVSSISSASGVGLVYSTHLGGSSDDWSYGIAVDAAGSAHLTGYTFSADFPTATPYDGTLGYRDAFVAKLSPAGNTLVYSTYLGGSSTDGGGDIAVDGAGSAYVTGWTSSSNFPTANAFDSSFNGGGGDAFVTKLNPAGNTLIYSSYFRYETKPGRQHTTLQHFFGRQ